MDAYIGEIRLFSGNYPPEHWALCHGQELPIQAYNVLFAVLGTAFGGDGRTTFALPDLRDRGPMHGGQGPGLSVRECGQKTGVATVPLMVDQIPSHNHLAAACYTPDPEEDPGLSNTPEGKVWAGIARPTGTAAEAFYRDTPGSTVAMAAAAIQPTGGDQPHNNLAPCLGISYIICLEGGEFPVRP